MSIQRKEFHALTGPEVKAIILREVEREIDNSGEFGNIYSFPQIDWTWNLSLNAYDRDDSVIPITAAGTIQNKMATKQIVLENERDFVEQPDAVRFEMGLGEVETVHKGGLIFDEQQPGSGRVQPKAEPAQKRPPHIAGNLDDEEVSNALTGVAVGDTGRVDFSRGINIKERRA